MYPSYDVGCADGRRFLYAPMDEPEGQIFGRRRYRPLSRPTAALFLEFARWPETEGMDAKPFETPRNEAAAKEWAEINGVLGLSSPPPFTIFDAASEAIEHSLGIWGGIRSRDRNEAQGGFEETVEAFAKEAWIANMALRIYEAATNSEGPDVGVIVAHNPSAVRRFNGKNPEAARGWALQVVEEIVEDRVRGHVWPRPVRGYSGRGDYAGHKQGWAFDSLLGAMWLQMLWLMRGYARRCEWCKQVLDLASDREVDHDVPARADGRRKPRSDRRFCGNNGKCKAKWNYHHGTGASSKAARKKRRGNRNT